MGFRRVDDLHFESATQAIDSARRGGYAGKDKADIIAAGAALSLERGAPGLMSDNHETKADRYLDQNTLPWSKLHCAVSRFIETSQTAPEEIGSPGDGVRRVVADIAQQVSAMKVLAAAGNKDFETSLNSAQRELAENARLDPSFKRQIASIKVGDYHELSPDMSSAMEQALKLPLESSLEKEVVKVGMAVSAIIKREEGRAIEIFGEENFASFSPQSSRRVLDFHAEGVTTKFPRVDAALMLLAERGRGMDFGAMDPADQIAQARLVAEGEKHAGADPSYLAARAITDAKMINAARDSIKSEVHPSPQMEAMASGNYEKLDPARQSEVAHALKSASLTPAIDKVTIEVAKLDKGLSFDDLDLSQGQSDNKRGMDPASLAALQNQFGR